MLFLLLSDGTRRRSEAQTRARSTWRPPISREAPAADYHRRIRRRYDEHERRQNFGDYEGTPTRLGQDLRADRPNSGAASPTLAQLGRPWHLHRRHGLQLHLHCQPRLPGDHAARLRNPVQVLSRIITIGLTVYRLYDLPWFRTLSWFFLFASNYFFFGENLIEFWSVVLRKDQFMHFLVAHHRLISFALYCLGFVWFVLSLRKGYYMRQFSLFAWTHVTLLLIVSQSFLIIQNIFQGIIWFLVPVAMIICCDIMSYVFGFFFGKTP